MYEKQKIFIHRLIWLVLLIVTVGVSIKYWTDWLQNSESIWDLLVIFLDIFIPTFFICTLLLSCKIYDYNGTEIIVYAGWYHHYIKVSEKLMDEHNTIQFFTPIVMSATMNDGTVLQATISLTNRISLKINNQLYTKEK